MNNCIFKATGLIAEEFDRNNIKYEVSSFEMAEILVVGHAIKSGPNILINFISNDDDSDVTVYVMGTITNIPIEKRLKLCEICNKFNSHLRYLRFYVEEDGDVAIQYDFPTSCTDDSIGKMAVEIYARIAQVLDLEYENILKELLYSHEE